MQLKLFLAGLTGLLICGLGDVPSACADSDWIRPGSFLDWPESLQHDATSFDEDDFPETQQPAITQIGFDQEVIAADVTVDPGKAAVVELASAQCAPRSTYTWQLLPDGLLYHSYLAGEKEPRTAATWLWDKDRGLVWEAAVGGRFGVLRHGTQGTRAEGFQLDVEGAALVRIDPEVESDLEAADFRAGVVGTWRRGPWRWKFGYSHISCHLGDEYLIKNPGVTRYNYVRDSILGGITYDITPRLQIYGETAFALGHEGGAEPVELQFGIQYSPAFGTGFRGAPFAAINGHLRQEYDFGGSVNVEAGWAWRGAVSDHLFRVGFQHYNGPSMQWSLVDRYECLTGLGMWFDY